MKWLIKITIFFSNQIYWIDDPQQLKYFFNLGEIFINNYKITWHKIPI